MSIERAAEAARARVALRMNQVAIDRDLLQNLYDLWRTVEFSGDDEDIERATDLIYPHVEKIKAALDPAIRCALCGGRGMYFAPCARCGRQADSPRPCPHCGRTSHGMACAGLLGLVTREIDLRSEFVD